MNTKCKCGGKFHPMPNFKRGPHIYNFWVCDKCDRGVERRARAAFTFKDLVRKQPTASRSHR